MKTVKIVISLFFILLLFGVLYVVSISNTERKLYQAGLAAQQNSEVVFDATWKTIKSQAQVTEEYKDGFKEIYTQLMEDRYKNDANAGKETLMKWVQEANPSFDSGLYLKLMNTIEGSRNAFTFEQKKLIDINREHKTFKMLFPNYLIIGDRPDLEIKLVTSTATKEAFSTTNEDDINLF